MAASATTATLWRDGQDVGNQLGAHTFDVTAETFSADDDQPDLVALSADRAVPLYAGVRATLDGGAAFDLIWSRENFALDRREAVGVAAGE